MPNPMPGPTGFGPNYFENEGDPIKPLTNINFHFGAEVVVVKVERREEIADKVQQFKSLGYLVEVTGPTTGKVRLFKDCTGIDFELVVDDLHM